MEKNGCQQLGSELGEGWKESRCSCKMATWGILNCGLQDLFVTACELLVSACGIYFPEQGLNLVPLH